MASSSKESWVGCIKKILSELNLGAFSFQNPERYTKTYIPRTLSSNLWHCNLLNDDRKQRNQVSKLRTVRLFKLQFEFES